MDPPSSRGPPKDAGAPTHGEMRATLARGEIHLRIPCRPELVAGVRALPGRRWDGKARGWRIPDTREARAALRAVLGLEPEGDGLPRRDTEAPRPPAATSLLPSLEAPATQPPLPPSRQSQIDRVDGEMRLPGCAVRTQKAYGGHVRRLLRDTPEEGDLASELRGHVLRRLQSGRGSRAPHSQLLSALRLFCSAVLGHRVEELPLARPRREQRLPTVLSRGELRRLLGAIPSPKHGAILALAYSGGATSERGGAPAPG